MRINSLGFKARIAAFLGTIFLSVWALPASGSELGEEACFSDRNISSITKRFAWAEKNTWHRGYVIEAINNARFRYNVFNGPTLIRHTHCVGTALMTNGTRRTVYYTVEEGMGFASMGNGVEFCVIGLDPWRAFDAGCRTLR